MKTIPLPIVDTITEEEVKNCKDNGECCQCGLCCIAFKVTVPKPVNNEPGTVDADGEQFISPMGDMCPHLIRNNRDRFECALHNSPHKPEVCKDWKGNQLQYTRPSKKAATDDSVDRAVYDVRYGGQYNRMLYNVYTALTMLTSPKRFIAIKEMLQIGALHLFRGNEQIRADDGTNTIEDFYQAAEHCLQFIVSSTAALGTIDEELFSLMRVYEYIEHLKQTDKEKFQYVLRKIHQERGEEFFAEFKQYILQQRALK